MFKRSRRETVWIPYLHAAAGELPLILITRYQNAQQINLLGVFVLIALLILIYNLKLGILG